MREFHAEHCEHRKGFWETWTDPTERLAAASRFLDLITVNRLPFPTVYATGVDLKCFKEVAAPLIETAHPGKRLVAPGCCRFIRFSMTCTAPRASRTRALEPTRTSISSVMRRMI
jgi:hypothetical protein